MRLKCICTDRRRTDSQPDGEANSSQRWRTASGAAIHWSCKTRASSSLMFLTPICRVCPRIRQTVHRRNTRCFQRALAGSELRSCRSAAPHADCTAACTWRLFRAEPRQHHCAVVAATGLNRSSRGGSSTARSRRKTSASLAMLPWLRARAATLPMLSACDWAFGSLLRTGSCYEPRSASPYIPSINVANSGCHVWMKTSTGAPTARTMWARWVSAQKRMRRRLALRGPPRACRDCDGDWSQAPARPWRSSAYRMRNRALATTARAWSSSGGNAEPRWILPRCTHFFVWRGCFVHEVPEAQNLTLMCSINGAIRIP